MSTKANSATAHAESASPSKKPAAEQLAEKLITALSPKSSCVYEASMKDLIAQLGVFAANLPETSSLEKCKSLTSVLDQHSAAVATKFEEVRAIVIKLAENEVNRQQQQVAKQQADLNLLRRITHETKEMNATLHNTKDEPSAKKSWGAECDDDDRKPKTWAQLSPAPAAPMGPAKQTTPVIHAPILTPIARPVQAAAPNIFLSVHTDAQGLHIKISYGKEKHENFVIGGRQMIDNTGNPVDERANELCVNARNRRQCDADCFRTGHATGRPQIASVAQFLQRIEDFVYTADIKDACYGDRLRWAITAVMLLDNYKVDFADTKLNKTYTGSRSSKCGHETVMPDVEQAAMGKPPKNAPASIAFLLRRIVEASISIRDSAKRDRTEYRR